MASYSVPVQRTTTVFWSFPFPDEHEKGIGAAVGEKEQRVFEGDGAGFVLDTAIPPAVGEC